MGAKCHNQIIAIEDTLTECHTPVCRIDAVDLLMQEVDTLCGQMLSRPRPFFECSSVYDCPKLTQPHGEMLATVYKHDLVVFTNESSSRFKRLHNGATEMFTS